MLYGWFSLRSEKPLLFFIMELARLTKKSSCLAVLILTAVGDLIYISRMELVSTDFFDEERYELSPGLRINFRVRSLRSGVECLDIVIGECRFGFILGDGFKGLPFVYMLQFICHFNFTYIICRS